MTDTSAKTSGAAKASRARKVARKPGGARRRPDGGAGALGALVLAMLFGVLGFLLSAFWVASLVVMALLLGLMVAERRGSSSGRGVVSEVVAAVVDEVQDISELTSRGGERKTG